jgi:hypothetical protein
VALQQQQAVALLPLLRVSGAASISSNVKGWQRFSHHLCLYAHDLTPLASQHRLLGWCAGAGIVSQCEGGAGPVTQMVPWWPWGRMVCILSSVVCAILILVVLCGVLH